MILGSRQEHRCENRIMERRVICTIFFTDDKGRFDTIDQGRSDFITLPTAWCQQFLIFFLQFCRWGGNENTNTILFCYFLSLNLEKRNSSWDFSAVIRHLQVSGTCFSLSPLKKQRNLNFQFMFIHDQIARRRDRLMGTIHRLVPAHHDHLEQLTVRMISRHLEADWLNLNCMDDWASNLGLSMAAWFLEEECLWFVAAVRPQRCPCRRHLASPFSYGADCYAVLILFPSLSLRLLSRYISSFHISTLPKATQYWLPSCNMYWLSDHSIRLSLRTLSNEVINKKGTMIQLDRWMGLKRRS